jgi:hypothetical protein
VAYGHQTIRGFIRAAAENAVLDPAACGRLAEAGCVAVPPAVDAVVGAGVRAVWARRV